MNSLINCINAALLSSYSIWKTDSDGFSSGYKFLYEELARDSPDP